MAIVLNRVIRKSRMKREFHVRFCERVGAIRPSLYSTSPKFVSICQFTPLSIFANFDYFCQLSLEILSNIGWEFSIYHPKPCYNLSQSFKTLQYFFNFFRIGSILFPNKFSFFCKNPQFFSFFLLICWIFFKYV
jgi:hypothetical protein